MLAEQGFQIFAEAGMFPRLRQDDEELGNLGFVRICGVMGMATFTVDSERIRNEFRYLAQCFTELKGDYFAEKPEFREISMGMSGDYQIAIGEGSTIVRIGSLIFGERNL